MRRSGFSLIELMMVVAIIGALAAIAVPSYGAMQLRAKRAEAPSVLEGVAQAEIAYYAVADAWGAAASNPGTSLTREARAWKPEISGWAVLGFAPDGPVRCSYIASVFNSGGWARADAFCDVDDDNKSYILRYYIPSDDPAQSYQGFREVDQNKY